MGIMMDLNSSDNSYRNPQDSTTTTTDYNNSYHYTLNQQYPTPPPQYYSAGTSSSSSYYHHQHQDYQPDPSYYNNYGSSYNNYPPIQSNYANSSSPANNAYDGYTVQGPPAESSSSQSVHHHHDHESNGITTTGNAYYNTISTEYTNSAINYPESSSIYDYSSSSSYYYDYGYGNGNIEQEESVHQSNVGVDNSSSSSISAISSPCAEAPTIPSPEIPISSSTSNSSFVRNGGGNNGIEEGRESEEKASKRKPLLINGTRKTIPVLKKNDDSSLLFSQSTLTLILSNIQPPLSNLSTLRLVCKTWDQAASQILLSKCKTTFTSIQQLNKFSNLMKTRKSNNQQSLFTFNSFTFEENLLLESIEDRNSNSRFLKFFETFGENVVKLDLNCEQLQFSVLKMILQNLCNLEELSLPSRIIFKDVKKRGRPFKALVKGSSAQFKLGKVRKVFFNSAQCEIESKSESTEEEMKELLNIFENLEQVQVQHDHSNVEFPIKIEEVSYEKLYTQESQIGAVLKAYKGPCCAFEERVLKIVLLSGNHTFPLKKLHLPSTSLGNVDFFKILTEKKLPLTELNISFTPSTPTQMTLLSDFLHSVKSSLTKAKITIEEATSSETSPVDLNLWKNLETLKSIQLEGYKGSLSFLERTPVLESLILRRVKLAKVVLKDFHEAPSVKPESILTSLKIFKVYQDSWRGGLQTGVQAIQKLGIQFPSLRVLRLEGLMDENLCLIYAQWPMLESLELMAGNFTDSGTTGIHPNAYKVILREAAWDRYDPEVLRQGLGVCSLARLKRIKIQARNITDVTVFFGLLKCPNLTSVVLKDAKITNSALSTLSSINHPNILHLKTKNCSQLSLQAVEFARSKMAEKGGSSSLNEYKNAMGLADVIKFLRKRAQPKVAMKRLPMAKSRTLKRHHPVVVVSPPICSTGKSSVEGNDSAVPLQKMPRLSRVEKEKVQDKEGSETCKNKVLIPEPEEGNSQIPTRLTRMEKKKEQNEDQSKRGRKKGGRMRKSRKRLLVEEEEKVKKNGKVHEAKDDLSKEEEEEISQKRPTRSTTSVFRMFSDYALFS